MTTNPVTADQPLNIGGHLALVLAAWLRFAEGLAALEGDGMRLSSEVW